MAKVKIDAGICGFVTEVVAESEDMQYVALRVESPCPNVQKLAEELTREPLDALLEIAPRKSCGRPNNSRILEASSKHIPHPACPVCVGILKAVEVAVGLALPKDAIIEVRGAE
ncbi:MAG: DUF6951 family protein [bacterium]